MKQTTEQLYQVYQNCLTKVNIRKEFKVSGLLINEFSTGTAGDNEYIIRKPPSAVIIFLREDHI
jgi:hypothetical protein